MGSMHFLSTVDRIVSTVPPNVPRLPLLEISGTAVRGWHPSWEMLPRQKLVYYLLSCLLLLVEEQRFWM